MASLESASAWQTLCCPPFSGLLLISEHHVENVNEAPDHNRKAIINCVFLFKFPHVRASIGEMRRFDSQNYYTVKLVVYFGRDVVGGYPLDGLEDTGGGLEHADDIEGEGRVKINASIVM